MGALMFLGSCGLGCRFLRCRAECERMDFKSPRARGQGLRAVPLQLARLCHPGNVPVFEDGEYGASQSEASDSESGGAEMFPGSLEVKIPPARIPGPAPKILLPCSGSSDRNNSSLR